MADWVDIGKVDAGKADDGWVTVEKPRFRPPEVEMTEPRRSPALFSALEAGTNVLSQMASMPIAGLAGAGHFIGSKLGLADEDYGGTVESVMNALTYQPRLEGGQKMAKAVMYPFEKAGELNTYLADETLERALASGVPTDQAGSLAAQVKAAGDIALMGLGRASKVPTVRPAPAPPDTSGFNPAGFNPPTFTPPDPYVPPDPFNPATFSAPETPVKTIPPISSRPPLTPTPPPFEPPAKVGIKDQMERIRPSAPRPPPIVAPAPATPTAPAEFTPRPPDSTVVPRHAVAPSDGGFPIPETTSIPVEGLKLSKDVPQFKAGADERGLVEPLSGDFDRRGLAPIVVWERLNGDKEIVSGRHRWALAQDQGIPNIDAQVFREADGFTKKMAVTLDAELNIRDGQGSIADYANYFKNSGITAEEAQQRGLVGRNKGRAGFSIGNGASEETFAAHQAGRLSDEAAFEISRVAPKDSALQAVGLRMVMDGRPINLAVNTMQAVRQMTGHTPEQADIFGLDTSMMEQAQKMAARAAAEQRALSEQINAVAGAAKRPETAAKFGVNVKDPEGIRIRLEQLRAERARWDNWAVHPDLVAKAKEGAQVPKPRVKSKPGVAAPIPEAEKPPSVPPQTPIAETPKPEFDPTLIEARPDVVEKLGAPTTETPEAAPTLTFQTAKGSVYEVHGDGTTTRGGQEGPQQRSKKTFYVSEAMANVLAEIQTKDAVKRALVLLADPDDPAKLSAGIMYLEGKNAGQIEKRTFVPISATPEVGMIPVELWKGGQDVHFGSKITKIGTPAETNPNQGGMFDTTGGEKTIATTVPKGEAGETTTNAPVETTPTAIDRTKPYTTYDIVDGQTGKVVSSYTNKTRARNKMDELDNEYGAYRYRVEPREVGVEGIRPSLLRGQTEAEIRQAEADAAKAKAAEERAARDAEAKAKADRERADFQLTGSDRPADANPYQKDILDMNMGVPLPIDALRNSKLGQKTGQLADDLLMKINPMGQGSSEAKAIMKDFANEIRRVYYDWGQIQKFITKNFKPIQWQKMWEAGDEQNALLLRGEDTTGKGLDRLTRDERDVVEKLHDYAEEVYRRGVAVNMFPAEGGLPYWLPRMVAIVGEGGKIGRPPGPAGQFARESPNIFTNAPSARKRKYVLAEETEAAAKESFGENAQLVRDIRTMPMALARIEQAIAGRELINALKEAGRATGADIVRDGGGDGFHTISNPAFREWRPRFITDEATGRTVAAKDHNGHTIFEPRQLYIRDDFYGPLKAISTEPNGEFYSAMMDLKGRTMGVIMYSPLIHNLVEFGRALPAAPGKVASLSVYFDGAKFLRDPESVRNAIRHGYVPIGSRFGFQDLTGMLEEANLRPGRSLTAKALALPFDLFSKQTGDIVRRGVDIAGDWWHNTLLWDLVGKLQGGLYTHFRDAYIKNGFEPDIAEHIAAHLANRYAGALPNEAMSNSSRKIANMMLFSRTFTLGNIGVMKDIFKGLPSEVLAQIERDWGTLKAAEAKSASKGKAVQTFIADIGFMYAGLNLFQSMTDILMHDQSADDVAKGYARRWKASMKKIDESPFNAVNYLTLPHDLSPGGEHEPGKAERVWYGTEPDGTRIYVRLPSGKIGEEMMGYVKGPMDMFRHKTSTFARPLLDWYKNDAGFGRPLYDAEAPFFSTETLRSAGRIIQHIAEAQIPIQSLQSAAAVAKGEGTDTDFLKVVGPLMGVTFSVGAPGGEAVGELLSEERRHRNEVSMALPDIKRKVKIGDTDAAIKLMDEAHMTEREKNVMLRNLQTPSARLSPRRLNDFYQHADDEQKQKMDRVLK